jgi:energy-coupling factor transporter ATP-binding protein EcfA2
MATARPLLDNTVDAKAFAGRATELARLERAVARDAGVAVVGARGSGKTSLLHMLQLRLRDQGRHALFVDGRALVDLPGLLRRVIDRLPAGQTSPLPPWWGRGDVDVLALLSLLPPVPDRSGTSPVVLCDELPSAEVGHTLFGRLRDELWSAGLTWVVAMPTTWQSVVLEPPADAFFETMVVLPPLDAGEATALLRARVGGPTARQLSKAMRTGALAPPPTPRALLRLATLAEETSPEEAVSWAARPDPTAGLPRPEAMLVQELQGNGPASASDAQMLSRLGWTRTRAVQVLRALAEKGIVAGYEVPNPRGGRPLKRYRLTQSWL